ncbi:terminase small subunit [Asticcacaulis solisilvae]|uniref:terminase small subunit n=1 Tax=Asticcacaulis solisilvae TaxID=1217274 RepID=UPI003FD70096
MPKKSRPFTTPRALSAAIDAYFDSRTPSDRPTVTGLAMALGLNRRQLIGYGDDDDYADIVAMARARVEAFNENRLYDGNVTGTIFNLRNNFGWEDKRPAEAPNGAVTVVTGVPAADGEGSE